MTACLSSQEFARLIDPLINDLSESEREVSIRDVILQILRCVQSFVPSEAGSVMLAHPDQAGALVFVASFGAGSELLPGTVLPPGTGISGQVYLSGKPAMTNSPAVETTFYEEIDKLTEHHTNSLLCVPVEVFGRPVGVLSLLNATSGKFTESDLNLMSVFGDYLTHSVQLLIEVRRERKAALIDHLTGLHNDRFLYLFLQETIEVALAEKHDVGLVFLDLDHFKAVVDTHGHLVGSQALREVGLLIGVAVEEFSGVAARYGGDEYVVVLPKGTEDQIRQLAEKLRVVIQHAVLRCESEPGRSPIVLQGSITASVGAAALNKLQVKNKDSKDLRLILIREADRAMYVAKAKGKNCVHWAPDDVKPSAQAD